MEDLAFDIELGARRIAGCVPLLIPDRLTLISALAEDFPPAEGAMRAAAVLGLAWADREPLDVPTLRELGYDVTEYGKHCWDRLYRLGLAGDAGWYGHLAECDACSAEMPGCDEGVGLHAAHERTIVPQALRAHGRVLASMPTIDEIEAAADPFAGPEEVSTETT